MADNITPDPQGAAGPNPADGNAPYSFEQPRADAEGAPQPPYGNAPYTNYYGNGQAFPPPPYPGAGQAPYPGNQPQYGHPMQGYPQYNQGPKIPGTTDSGYNIMALVSLIGGICSYVLLPFVGALVGIICGHMGVKQIKENGGQGRNMAIAGMVLGYINIALSIISVIAIIGLVGLQVGISTFDVGSAAMALALL